MLTKSKIENSLKGLGVDIPVVFYELTDSTNTRAKEFAKSRADRKRTPVLFVANGQTNGRGRMGRSFVSNLGSGIYMSLLLYPEEKGYDTTRATAEAAVALARAVESLCDAHPEIKWVNDLYLGERKLAGILCEGELLQSGEIGYLVVGMGINVYKNAISEDISAIATSIESEINSTPDRSDLTAMTVKELLNKGDSVYTEYKARSLVIGRYVTVIVANESYTAKAIDIGEDYSLIVERDGKIERLFTGEVSLKI